MYTVYNFLWLILSNITRQCLINTHTQSAGRVFTLGQANSGILEHVGHEIFNQITTKKVLSTHQWPVGYILVFSESNEERIRNEECKNNR